MDLQPPKTRLLPLLFTTPTSPLLKGPTFLLATNYYPRLQRSLYALLTTKWPVWHALDRIQKPPVQEVLKTQEGAPDKEGGRPFCG